MADIKANRKRCGCCNEDLDPRTFRRHYSQNYDKKAKRWRKMFDGSSDDDDCTQSGANEPGENIDFKQEERQEIGK